MHHSVVAAFNVLHVSHVRKYIYQLHHANSEHMIYDSLNRPVVLDYIVKTSQKVHCGSQYLCFYIFVTFMNIFLDIKVCWYRGCFVLTWDYFFSRNQIYYHYYRYSYMNVLRGKLFNTITCTHLIFDFRPPFHTKKEMLKSIPRTMYIYKSQLKWV